MGFFTKDIKSLNDLFMHGLQDIYYAENQIMKSLPAMIEKATNEQLRAGFEKHLAETEGQVHRLRQVFELLETEPKGDKCPAIEGILKDQGYTLSDVAMMRVYLVGDPAKGGKMDFEGFMSAYTQFFGTKEQPNLPARSTVQVASLVAPGMLVEIEIQLAK